MDLRGGQEMTDDPTAEASALLSGSPQDAAEGLRRLRKAAADGDCSACLMLGREYMGGGAVDADEEEAERWFRLGADRGDPPCMASLGALLRQKGDAEGAVRFLTKASDAGSSEAEGILALMYLEGEGVDRDPLRAEDLLRSASGKGNTDAKCDLARCICAGTVRGTQDEAFSLLCDSAEAGNPEAMYGIGLMYETGQAVRTDRRKAFEWYRSAASAGSADAKYRLGTMYELGDPVEADAGKAFEMYLSAALAGSAEGVYSTGLAYLDGIGIGKDPDEAAKWFSLGSSMGDTLCMSALGYMLLNGTGIPKDEAAAFDVFSKGRDAGSRECTLNLAAMYDAGIWVRHDPERAASLRREAVEMEGEYR